MRLCSCWQNKQYEEIIEDVKVRKGDAQAEWNCLWVSFLWVVLEGTSVVREVVL